MNGVIRKLDDTYPITVMEAVKVGNDTADKLTDWLRQNYMHIGGEAGQLPVSNGDGTFSWVTIVQAEEGEY